MVATCTSAMIESLSLGRAAVADMLVAVQSHDVDAGIANKQRLFLLVA